MLRKVKFTIDNTNDTFAKVPYKSGYVTWKMFWHSQYTYRWMIWDSPDHYNPVRVRKAHEQFMNGKMFKSKMVKYAAASHNWGMKDRYEKALNYERKTNENIARTNSYISEERC